MTAVENNETSDRQYVLKVLQLEREAQVENNLKRINVDKKIMESKICYLKNGDRFHDYKYMFENNCLTLVDSNVISETEADKPLPNGTVLRIPKDKIKFYTRNGNVTYSTYAVQTGKDFSLSGAVTGALIGGGIGAVIGSQKDANKTETRTTVHDQRVFYLYYEENNEVKCISSTDSSAGNFYDFLHNVMLDKDYEYIQAQVVTQQRNESNASERLKQLNELHDSGLITDEEYNQKRNELISAL